MITLGRPPQKLTAVLTLAACAVAGKGIAPIGASSSAAPVQVEGAASPAAPSRPNILLVTVDDAAASDLRWMPKVRRLIGDQGVRVTNALAPTPLCVPARATLLSGQYAHNHGALGIRGRHGSVRSFDDRRTLPTWLRRAGYDTYFVGKYLNGYGRNSKRYVPPGWTGWQGSIDPFTYNYARTVTNRNGTIVRDERYSTDSFARMANRVLRREAKDADPFYLWVNYVAPHKGGPRERDDPRRRFAGHTIDTPAVAERHRNSFRHLALPDVPSLFRTPGRSIVNASQRPWAKRARAALRESYQQRIESLQAVDEAVGSHLRVLRRTGQLRNTIVAFTSDNGFLVGQHNLNGKLWFYQESVQVPLVIRGPGIPRGRTVDDVVTHADLPVTFAALAQARPNRRVDGTDVWPVLSGQVVSSPQRVVPIAAYPITARTTRRLYSGVRVGNDWSYAVAPSGVEEIYDLRRDRYQLTNLARDPRFAERRAWLRGLARQYRDCAGEQCR
ncbi:sulfatase [Nocardioides sp. Bht2]|uniref:sulfatase family protein n=1 Tax=Nocardioides sp. Bht2 TaxID=3392297 RepID=UPI0039B53D62